MTSTRTARRARIYLHQGKFQDAINDLDKVISDVASGRLLLRRASAYHGLRNDEMAAKDAEAALKRAPDDVELVLGVGYFYATIKQHDKAIDTFDKLIDKDPKNGAAFAGRADTYLRIGNHQMAVKDLNRSLKHEPNNSHVLNDLAWLLATSPDDKVRDGRRAIELAQKACELMDYKDAITLSTLAAGYAETGDFDTAIKWVKKALELQGDVATVEQSKKELASYEAKKPYRERLGGN